MFIKAVCCASTSGCECTNVTRKTINNKNSNIFWKSTMIPVLLILSLVAQHTSAQSTLDSTTTSTETIPRTRTCIQRRTECVLLTTVTCRPGQVRKEIDWSTDADGCRQCPRVECSCPTCAQTPFPCANGKLPDKWNTTDNVETSGKKSTNRHRFKF